jgi:hypothetical protein
MRPWAQERCKSAADGARRKIVNFGETLRVQNR